MDLRVASLKYQLNSSNYAEIAQETCDIGSASLVLVWFNLFLEEYTPTAFKVLNYSLLL